MNIFKSKGEVIAIVVATLAVVGTLLSIAKPALQKMSSKWADKHQLHDIVILNDTEQPISIDITELDYQDVTIDAKEEIGVPDFIERNIKIGSPVTLIAQQGNLKVICAGEYTSGFKFVIKRKDGKLGCQVIE